MSQFGGEQALAIAWKEAFTEASACRRLRGVAALIEILRWLEATDEPESLGHLTDEELQARLRSELATIRA
jgi:hypothetical protein